MSDDKFVNELTQIEEEQRALDARRAAIKKQVVERVKVMIRTYHLTTEPLVASSDRRQHLPPSGRTARRRPYVQVPRRRRQYLDGPRPQAEVAHRRHQRRRQA